MRKKCIGARGYFLFYVVVGLFLVGGCGGTTGPETVLCTGTVTLDGTPLTDAMIAFKDVGSHEKTYAGKITDGKFEFPSTVGQKKVEITADRETPPPKGMKMVGGTPGDPISAENPAIYKKQIIPARYNDKSELVANVVSKGPNKFDYELKSK